MAARILVLDIETAPIVAHVWNAFKAFVPIKMIKDDWYIMSFSYKWLGDNDVVHKQLPDYPLFKRDRQDDSALVSDLWDVLDGADIVVWHNGKRFDKKRINARFLLNGITIPPTQYKQVDTLEIAKREFGFTSNSLEYLAKHFSIEQKLKNRKFNGADLWLECLAGNMEAWEEMRVYNNLDIISLESVYLKLRSWWHQHPNVQLEDDLDALVTPKCRVCGAPRTLENILRFNGYRTTSAGRYRKWQCKCGAYNSDPENLLSKEQRMNISRRT